MSKNLNDPDDCPIPIVNVESIGLCKENPSENEFRRVGKEIAKAFEQIGFVYLMNHGIPKSLISRVHKNGASFFELPDNIKRKYSKKKQSTSLQGYITFGRELLDTSTLEEFRESFDSKNIEEEGISEIGEVPDFRGAVDEVANIGMKFCRRLIEALEYALDLPRETLLKNHKRICSETNGSLIRILHYPRIGENIPKNSIRCGEHTDYGTLTLLFQDDMGGLEVQNRKKRWQPADPVPDAVLVNVSDLLEMWTGGKFVATRHRVLIPEEELRRKCCRRSFVFFIHPDDEVTVKPLQNSNPKYPPMRAGDHLRSSYKKTYVY